MGRVSRRRFLERSTKTIVALGAGSLAARSPLRAMPASETVSLAAIGIGGRCSTLIRGLVARGDVRFKTLCDVYPARDSVVAMRKHLAGKQGAPPDIEQDFRRVLDDGDVQGVVIATPDHWHAPLAVRACQAEKDVYVEKPPCHNVWEGRKMVEAEKRYKRVLQVGTQNRSAPYVKRALELVRGGAIGSVHLCKVFNLKSGGPYRPGPAGKPPAGMDYDTWLGPCPERPFRESICFGGGWHRYWDFSGGDMADDGVHQLDIARWLVGKELPVAVCASGGNFAYKDEREVPDTQVVTYEFDDLVMTFELTQYPPYMKKTNGQIRGGDAFPPWMQNSTRIELYGTRKMMVIGRHGGGWQILSSDGNIDEQMYGRFPDPFHQENFVHCIRTRDKPNASAVEGHRSSALVHLGNLSYRLGRKLQFDPRTETVTGDGEANRMLKREYRDKFELPEIV